MSTDRNEANIYILTVLLVGLFIGMGINFWLGLRTFIRIDTLFHILILAGVAAIGIHYLLFRNWDRYFAEIAAYNIIGWGNIILAILLIINYLKHDEPVTTSYTLKNVSLLVGRASRTEIGVNDPLFADYPHMLNFSPDEIHGRYVNGEMIANTASFTTANGIMGYKILLKKELR